MQLDVDRLSRSRELACSARFLRPHRPSSIPVRRDGQRTADLPYHSLWTKNLGRIAILHFDTVPCFFTQTWRGIRMELEKRSIGLLFGRKEVAVGADRNLSHF